MRQVHRAGEKAFIDHAVQRPTPVDVATGEVVSVELFVAVLGASNYTYAEATRTQQSVDWIASHTRAVEYFGGVPAASVPRPAPHRRDDALLLRTGRAADLRGVGRALSHGHPVGAPSEAARQQGRCGRAGREAVELARLRHEVFTSLAALNAPDPGAADRAQCAADEGLWRPIARRSLRPVRPAGLAAAAGGLNVSCAGGAGSTTDCLRFVDVPATLAVRKGAGESTSWMSGASEGGRCFHLSPFTRAGARLCTRKGRVAAAPSVNILRHVRVR